MYSGKQIRIKKIITEKYESDLNLSCLDASIETGYHRFNTKKQWKSARNLWYFYFQKTLKRR